MTKAEKNLRKYLTFMKKPQLTQEEIDWYAPYDIDDDVEQVLNMLEEARKYIKANKDKLCRLDRTQGKTGIYVSCDDELLKILGDSNE